MARAAMILGVLVYVVQLLVNKFVYQIPEPIYISVLVIACALMLYGIFMDKRMRRKDRKPEKIKNAKQK